VGNDQPFVGDGDIVRINRAKNVSGAVGLVVEQDKPRVPGEGPTESAAAAPREDALAAAVQVDLFGIGCLCVSLGDLILAKRAVARLKDFDALAELEVIMEERDLASGGIRTMASATRSHLNIAGRGSQCILAG
jgi:hypothetical protein